MPNLRQIALVSATAAGLFAAALPVSAKIFNEAAMVSHCAEVAATELGVRMNDVL